ncbi:hypothetical protein [Brevibacillus centrosporus]|uniref:hypothetical protein n=1 Tax=Brevibacillus centrosporus TaxID=54910 RepID=UPI003827BB70
MLERSCKFLYACETFADEECLAWKNSRQKSMMPGTSTQIRTSNQIAAWNGKQQLVMSQFGEVIM